MTYDTQKAQAQLAKQFTLKALKIVREYALREHADTFKNNDGLLDKYCETVLTNSKSKAIALNFSTSFTLNRSTSTYDATPEGLAKLQKLDKYAIGFVPMWKYYPTF